MVETMKSRVMVVVLAAMLMFTALAAPAPAQAKFDDSCYPRGGSTYHTHWEGTYHYTYYYSNYNEYWAWSSWWGWFYHGWEWCQ